jgi:Sec-independent protein translocase protein TatA
MPRPVKNIFTEKWMREFHQMLKESKASSIKLQASSSEKNKPQASSPKQQASSSKPQAAS